MLVVLFWSVIFPMLYIGVGGYSFSKIQGALKPKCRYHESNCDATCGHSVLAGFSVPAWPVILPMLAGALLGNEQVRRDRQIAKAEHKARLKEITL
jgi:hypothetical protein